MASLTVIKGFSSPETQHATPSRQVYKGRLPAYERALSRTRPVSPIEDRAGLVLAYADFIEGMVERDPAGKPCKPQLFVTLTPRPLGYRSTPVYPAKLVSGQGHLWSQDPETLHGRPIYVSEKIARRLKDRVIEEVKRIQGYNPDYISFHERQRNGNHHYHLAMSNVNLVKPAFQPVIERRDKRGKPQLAFRGLEEIAWGIMGRASFEFWGGLDGSLTAAYYFTKDMFRCNKGGEVDVEVSPLWGKRKYRQPQFTLTDNSLWTETEAVRVN